MSTLNNIERFGCSIVHIEGNSANRYSFTVGVFDTCGKPELITVGLTEKTAHIALNTAVKLLRSGVDLTQGRYREIVGEVECKFAAIDPKWMHHAMGRADWYYTGEEVPVIQLIYPDLKNRFQNEEGFEEYFRQPMLMSGVQDGTREHDFWAFNDPSSSISRWKFSDDPHTQAFLSETVHKKEEPVTYVSHDAEDGTWQFLGDKMSDGGGPVVSCLHHPIDNDPSLEELADLPRGWYATRESPAAPWQRSKLPPEEDEEAAISSDPS
ncbi:MAG TPA: DUF4262 domain-containing protein [Acidobacteriaceae bacterium]|nr:DUF4262 domain-containing protein [Acidobacteriaceae bacterium]